MTLDSDQATYRRTLLTERRSVWPVGLLVDETGSLAPRDLETAFASALMPITLVRFQASAEPNTALWLGYLDGQPVTGEIRMRCDARGADRFVGWAEITLVASSRREARSQNVPPTARDRTERARLETIARLGRELIGELRAKPRVATPDVIATVAKMVEAAEGDV
jgi:hypothetical protein